MKKTIEIVEVETDDCGMCSECKEYAAVINCYENGILVEQISNCCSAKIVEDSMC